jgi:dolichol-phosphate mannosyltransferase
MPERTARGPVWLVLPTYDEAENIESIVAAARSNLPGDARILIVDDDSPDGTGEIAERLREEVEGVEVLHRERKEGLGPAYIAGFRHALDAGAGIVLEMDSDFSHDPADLPRLLAAAERADLVIGSRYVPGGGTLGWGALRRVVSRGGSVYARLVLGLGIRDLTSGFKCMRRELLEEIDLETIDAKGYAFQVEVTYRAVKGGFGVTELPIIFRERERGKSKMKGAIVAEAAWKVPAMRIRRRGPGR